MKRRIFEMGFFYILILVILVLLFFIFKPFLTPVFLASVFAIIFYPIHKKIEKKLMGKEAIGSFVSTALVAVLIVAPLIIISALLLKEAAGIYTYLNTNGFGSVEEVVSSSREVLSGVLPDQVVERINGQNIESSLRSVLNAIVQNTAGFFTGAFSVLISIFIFFISLYYFFKDGDEFVKKLIIASPLEDDYDEIIVKKISTSVNSVVRGNLITAGIQGVLAGVGFAIAGIGAPILLGFIAVIGSLIPSVGTALAMIPAILYLLFNASYGYAIFLTVWAVVVVGLSDNILRPILIEKGLKVHPLLIFISVLGGIAFFGPVGILAGPISVSFASALFDIYPLISKKLAVEE